MALPVSSATEYVENVPLPSGVVIIGNADKEFGSEPKIQVNDSFITPGYLPEWIHFEYGRAPGKKWHFIWAIDQTVPHDFLQEIFHNIPRDSSLHYRLVRSSNDTGVLYERINLAEYQGRKRSLQ